MAARFISLTDDRGLSLELNLDSISMVTPRSAGSEKGTAVTMNFRAGDPMNVKAYRVADTFDNVRARLLKIKGFAEFIQIGGVPAVVNGDNVTAIMALAADEKAGSAIVFGYAFGAKASARRLKLAEPLSKVRTKLRPASAVI